MRRARDTLAKQTREDDENAMTWARYTVFTGFYKSPVRCIEGYEFGSLGDWVVNK